MKNLFINNVIIGGVLHPKLTIDGKKIGDVKLLLVTNTCEEYLNIKTEIGYKYVASKILDDKIPLKFFTIKNLNFKDRYIKIYNVKTNNKELIFKKNINVFNRIFSKISKIFKSFFVVLKKLPRTIKKTIVITWKRYHFIVPIKTLGRYIKSFKTNVSTDNINDKFYNPLEQSEYLKFLKENPEKVEYKKFKYNPLISVIIPVYNVKPKLLKECIDSVLNQTYQNFEICIADDHSTNEETIKVLKEYEKNKKINIVYRKKNGHISEASNSAISIAKGDFIGLLDNDDVLHKDALYFVVEALNNDKDLDFIYSDEDKLDYKGERCEPHFKPDFSPDTFLSSNYICHFSVIRTSIVKELKGFRSEYNGSQDYDLFLRVTEKTNKIYHIPRILYHWRMSETSTAASGGSKNYAYIAGKKALEDAFKRRGIKADVKLVNNPQMFIIKYANENELVSVIIPIKDNAKMTKQCIDSIYEKTTYKNYEIIVVDNGSKEEETKVLLESYKKAHKNFKVLRIDKEFNYSNLNNEAVKQASGEYLLLLNNDTEVMDPNYMEDMLGYARQDHVGAVGIKLLYKDDLIQHAGVVLGVGGVAAHCFVGTGCENYGYFGRLITPHNYSAVTAACLMVSKKKYMEVNGLDEKLKVAYNDVDFNIKLLEKGYYNVIIPVRMHHYESKSRGSDLNDKNRDRFITEIDYMISKWNKKILNDKFYNKNFSTTFPFYLDKKEDE